MDVIEKMAKAAWMSVRGFDQLTDAEKAHGVEDGFDDWNRWPYTGLSVDADMFRLAARAALIALRDADSVQMRMAGRNAQLSCPASPMADYSVSVGYGFRAMLDYVLQEGEKA